MSAPQVTLWAVVSQRLSYALSVLFSVGLRSHRNRPSVRSCRRGAAFEASSALLRPASMLHWMWLLGLVTERSRGVRPCGLSCLSLKAWLASLAESPGLSCSLASNSGLWGCRWGPTTLRWRWSSGWLSQLSLSNFLLAQIGYWSGLTAVEFIWLCCQAEAPSLCTGAGCLRVLRWAWLRVDCQCTLWWLFQFVKKPPRLMTIFV